MKKPIALFMCMILLLAACAPQTQTQETAAPGETSSRPETSAPASQAPDEEPPSVSAPEAFAPEEPASQAPSTPSQPADTPPQSGAPALSGKVASELTVYYDGESPRFSQKLSVPQSATFSGGADTVTVERKTETGWQEVRGGGTGNFTLEGKLIVSGPLPPQLLEDARAGTEYRITTVLQTGGGGEITAVNTFRAGEAFGDNAAQKAFAGPETFTVKTDLDTETGGLVGFTQTVTNTSGQTVVLDRTYTVLHQTAGGVWKDEPFPQDEQPTAGEALLLPGASYTETGFLPITAKQAKQGGRYRIVRTAKAAGAPEGRAKITFYAELEDGGTIRETAAESSDPPALRQVTLALDQTSFAAGEIPLGAWLENNAAEGIVAGKLRVYNVKDGENLLAEEAQDARVEIPAGGGAYALEHTLSLEPGEYTVEVTVWPQGSGTEALLAKNFTVERDKPKNPASAATVEMKVSIEGQTQDGLATFTQTFTNNSCQTLLAGRAFFVERPAGGLWVPADYPEGLAPKVPEDLVLLRPGASATLEGTLPFLAGEMPNAYRITRTLMVNDPLPSQKNGLMLVYTVKK